MMMKDFLRKDNIEGKKKKVRLDKKRRKHYRES